MDNRISSSLKFTEASICDSALVKGLAFILSVSDHNTLTKDEIYQFYI